MITWCRIKPRTTRTISYILTVLEFLYSTGHDVIVRNSLLCMTVSWSIYSQKNCSHHGSQRNHQVSKTSALSPKQAALGQKRENTREEVCPSQGSRGYTFSDVRLAKAQVSSHWCHQQVKSATLYHNILIWLQYGVRIISCKQIGPSFCQYKHLWRTL